MAIPASKQELLEALDISYHPLRSELLSLEPVLSRKKRLPEHQFVYNLVAYQIGWGRLLLGWYQTGLNGQIPELPAKGFKWNQLGDLTQHLYSQYSSNSYKKLLDQFDQVYREVHQLVKTASEKELYTLEVHAWTGNKWPLGRWINVNTSSPYKSALSKLRKWKKEMRSKMS